MICISIAQESRRLALADMLNAVQAGADLLEVRLDCFNGPNIPELLTARRKPVLFSCRRPRDGGHWKGSEADRLALLRQAMTAGADYVEVEFDVADQIPAHPPCRRVVSYTNLKATPADLADIHDVALIQRPDVVRLACKARTPEEAWPLVQLLAKPAVPTVAVGLGRPGLLLTVLGRKVGAPWAYAALERGAEAYPGQPTVRELDEVYHYRAINRSTRLVGVTGVDERAFATTGLLNAAFAHLGRDVRCLPVQTGDPKLFRKIIDAVRLTGVVLEPDSYGAVREWAGDLDPLAEAASAADLLLRTETGWRGCNALGPAVVAALIEVRPTADGAGPARPLAGWSVLLAGGSFTARLLAPALKQAGAALIFTSADKAAAERLAGRQGGRWVPWEAIGSTLHDVLIVCGEAYLPAVPEEERVNRPIHPGCLRSGRVALDLTALPRRSELLDEAAERGGRVVEPGALVCAQVREVLARLDGDSAAAVPLRDAWDKLRIGDQ